MSIVKITPSILNAALEGLEAKKAEIDRQIAEIRSMLGNQAAKRKQSDGGNLVNTPTRKRRVISPASRKRIADAQRLRWANARKESKKAEPKPAKEVARTGKRNASSDSARKLRPKNRVEQNTELETTPLVLGQTAG